MSFATIVRRRGSERVIALVSAMAVLLSMMAIFADQAQAHHPEISAHQTCADKAALISYTSESWQSGSGHPDIRIEVRVDGSGSWTEVASGDFTEENGYGFSGTIAGDAYWGKSIEVRARAVGSWDNGVGGGQTRSTDPFTVKKDCHNPGCPNDLMEFKIEPVGSGSFGPNDEFTLSVDDTVFSWTSTVPVYKVIAKGGPGAEVYTYSGEFSGSGLHAPDNASSGKHFGLSHITFCYQEKPDDEPEPVEVSVTPGVCEVGQSGDPKGSADVSISSAGNATVEIYENSDHTGLVATVTSSDSVGGLSPGTYYWTATAGDGFEIDGATEGEFTIVECEVSVAVVTAACSPDEQGVPLGSVNIAIDPTSGATVTVYTDAAMTDSLLTTGTGGDFDLAPGTYWWQATAGEGYELTGPTSGSVVVPDCESTVSVVTSGKCVLGDEGPVGTVDIDVDPDAGATVTIYSDEAMTQVVDSTSTPTQLNLEPGTYYWKAEAADGFDISGKSEGKFPIEECESLVTVVTSGECVLGDEGPVGTVDIDVDPDAGATVTIYSDAAMTQVVDSTSEPTQLTLEPGTYRWDAEAADGFDMSGESEGEFTIEPCDVTVDVGGLCIVDGDVGNGEISIEISVPQGATVVVKDSADQVVATLTESGTVPVSEGETYTWEATPADGMTIDGPFAGSVDIDDCTRSIELTVGGVCENNAPYLSWAVTPVNFDADEVTITWNDIDSDDPLRSSTQALSGTMAWPGTEFDAEGNVSDWAGWVFADGIWSPGEDGYENTRPDTSVTFSVNPSLTVDVDYPGGEPECEGPPPELFVDLDAVCDNDTPYLDYSATLSGNVDPDADTVTIHWFDADGVERDPADSEHTYSGLELSGRVLWPGARVDADNNPTDWPGWVLDSDEGWVPDDDGFLWSREEGAAVSLEVNPTSDTLEVVYPPAEPTCTANPVEDEVSDVEITDPDATDDSDNDDPEATDEVEDDPETLPFTGVNVDLMAVIATALMGTGVALLLSLRRREEQ